MNPQLLLIVASGLLAWYFWPAPPAARGASFLEDELTPPRPRPKLRPVEERLAALELLTPYLQQIDPSPREARFLSDRLLALITREP